MLVACPPNARPRFEGAVSLTLRIHLGASGARDLGRLEEYVRAVCEGLRRATPGVDWIAITRCWGLPTHAAVVPSFPGPLADSAEIYRIQARYSRGEGAPSYEVTLSDERVPG